MTLATNMPWWNQKKTQCFLYVFCLLSLMEWKKNFKFRNKRHALLVRALWGSSNLVHLRWGRRVCTPNLCFFKVCNVVVVHIRHMSCICGWKCVFQSGYSCLFCNHRMGCAVWWPVNSVHSWNYSTAFVDLRFASVLTVEKDCCSGLSCFFEWHFLCFAHACDANMGWSHWIRRDCIN